MPYPEIMVAPMRQEVDVNLKNASGTVLVVVNSICGCAAGKARPGVALALENSTKPNKLTTVFAGQDLEATAKARSYFESMPPSSPSVALLKDGKLVYMMHRNQIEGRHANDIATDLKNAFEQYCK
jgi:putative YphP/YqiW family bacilliredoxin